jgi:AraC-like DNA-binding protein
MGATTTPHLAQLGFRLIAPSQALRPYVQSYWYLQRDAPLLAYQEAYMHPRGSFGLVFNFGDLPHLDRQAIAEPLFLDGTTTVSRKMGFLGRIELFGVRFQEGGAYPVLGVPLVELRNEISLLDALERRSLLELHARLQMAASVPARIGLLETWLVQRLALGRELSALIPATLARLRQSVGQVPIPQLAQEFAISQRQLERLYQRQGGMSPKQYTRLLRVEAARLALKRMDQRSTGALAADLGFYDQPHFIREFRGVVGMTPYAYIRHSQRST